MRATLRLLPLLAILPAILFLPASSQVRAEVPPEESERILDYFWGTYEPEQYQEIVANLRELQLHLRENRPDFRSSFCTNYGLEPLREAHAYVEVDDPADLNRLWGTDDPPAKEGFARHEELVRDTQNVLLRQVAGPRRDGQVWSLRPFVRWSARVRFGKIGAGLEMARRLVEHVNANYPLLRARAYVEYFGRAGTLWWFIEVENASVWARVESRLHRDPEYLAILDAGADLFVPDSFDDRWMAPLR